MRKIFFSILFSFAISPVVLAADAPQPAPKIQFAVTKYQLKNGLVLLVHEDHTMPIISYQQWFRVGSSHEKPGRTGLAHFFEHLMFKGTKKYPKGEIDKVIQLNGGSNNAFTTEDYTGYYTNLPSDKIELIIDIESDRMRNLLFDEAEINNEREVVKEERRMRYENGVYGPLFELIRHTIYKTNEYRWPVIGYMADLNATKTEELKEFYNRYYAPNNAVVVVAGDVSASRVKSLVEKYYGNIQRQELPVFQSTPEAEQKSPRTSTLEKDVQSTTLAVVYPTVTSGHEDSYALDLLANVLGAGSSSRLYKRFVYKNQIATGASVSNDTNKLAGTLSIFLPLKPGVTSDRAVELLNAELSQVKTNLISDNELKKLKNQTILGYVQGLQTMAARAQSLATYEIVFGDYQRLFGDAERYSAVTKEDIQRVAKKYIVPTKRNNIQIVPRVNSGGAQ
jgi:zinc protease